MNKSNHECNDIDECLLGKGGCSQLCNNTVGSYRCSCNSGFTLDVDNHTCYDTNECVLGTSGCSQLCNNLVGSYICSCNSGYVLDPNNHSCNGVPRNMMLTATKSSIKAIWEPAFVDVSATANLQYKLICTSYYDLVIYAETNSTATLTNLPPFTSYTCCVKAYISVQFQSQVCDTIQTLEDAPSDPPSNIYVAPFSSTAVSISWYPPSHPNGIIIGSSIYVNYSNGTNGTIKLTGGNYRSYLLANMLPDQEVGIQIASFTNGGQGPRSTLQEGRTNCAKGTYYSRSLRRCTRQCGCGEGQVQYFYDSISGTQYPACVPVGDNQVGIQSISTNTSVYTNSPAGISAAKVIITYALPMTGTIDVRMTSHLYTPYYNFETWKYWWIPTSLDIKNQSSNLVFSPTWNGWWSGSNSIYWEDVSNNSQICNNGNGKQFAITLVDIYFSSPLLYQGELSIDLQFTQSNYYYWYYYWYWYYYGFVSGLIVHVKPNYNCPPLEYYNFPTQQCAHVCSCGLAVPRDSLYCATINPYWNYVTFAQHTFTYQVPFNSPDIPNISTRLYYTMDDWISRYFLDYYFYHNVNNTNSVHIALKVDLEYGYSNYTTKTAYGTDVPDVVITLADGTVITKGGSGSIVLDELSPLTTSCNRASDGLRLQFAPLVISASFRQPISSLGTHNFSINARLTSNNGIIDSWLQYYTDTISLSITTGSDANGSIPAPAKCAAIKNKLVPTLNLAKYGNVKSLPNSLYGVSDRIVIDVDPGFPFGNSLQSEVYVSSDGLISFGKPVVYSYPAKFPSNYQGIRNAYLVAPFWIFNDIRTAGSISYATINDKDTLQLVSKIINNNYNSSNFTAKWLLAVQWKGIHPYPYGQLDWWWGYYYGDIFSGIINKENSYQAILTTNGVSSYAVFTYECGAIGWSGYWDGWRAIVGYNANGDYYKNHPASGYDTLPEAVSCQNKACGTDTSNLFYNLSLPLSAVDKIRSDCINLYDEDVALHGDNVSIANIVAQLEPCPCSIWQVWRDWGRFRWQFSESYCFIQRFPTNLDAVQQCCYSSWSTGGVFGALITSGIDKGSMLLYHPRRSPDLYQKYDVDFKDKCCGIAKMCSLYTQRRPSDNCTAYQQPAWMWGWGDPHITTLDGRTYTFNGWGEYVILQYSSPSSQNSFTLQGRMVPVNMTTATQYSAFAFGNANNYTIEIGVTGSSFLYTYINGVNISSELELINSTYNNSDETILITREAENSISCITPVGASVTVTNTNGSLGFTVVVPPSWKGLTTGLMGNFNGNKSDEFVPRNKTMPLSDEISDRNLHWMFAQTWNALQFESLFTYRVDHNESWQFYSHPNHTPVFADEIIATEEQVAICGNDSACLYDLSQTNNTAFAVETMHFGQTNNQNVKLLNNFPPKISGNSTFIVAVEQVSIFDFTVEDTDDNITVGVVGGLSYDATLVGYKGAYTFSWTIPKVDNVSLTFFAMDSFNATSILSVQLQVCACRNGGNCTSTGLSNIEAQSIIMRCDCSKAYDGTFCEKDRNGCLEASCYTGVQCYDVPAPGVGITCGPCPTGYNGDGSMCTDINECSANSSTCQQVCTNTPGSYTCSCQIGYTMASNGMCTDIDECMGVNECQQTCINTAGSYYCDCVIGFQLDSDGQRCTVTNSCPMGNNCSDICVSVNSTITCFCSPGFTLGADEKTCNDIDECNQRPCEQTCRNTIGSFKCSCAVGFQLNADQRSCDDIDECRDASLNDIELCPDSFNCLNTRGSYLCTCPPGYQNRTGLCQVNIVPQIQSSATSFRVTVGKPSVYQFSVIDDDDTFTVGVFGGIPAGSNLTYDKGVYIFTWTLRQVQNVSLTFYAVDSLNASAQLAIPVLICACQNGGNCTLNESLDANVTSVVMTCECLKAYDGTFCEEDRNGCLDEFCYRGVQCYDVPAPGMGITCGPCPNGYTGDPKRECTDINECIHGTSGCSQSCVNTNGSYVCSCTTGYRLSSDNHTCDDTDECILRTDHCAQLCNNTVGSYTCSCNNGYTIDLDKHRCNDINECELGTSGCNQLCNNTNGSYTCYCDKGYTFDTSNYTCNDINECELGTSGCSQLCNNRNGSYTCYCNSGYILDVDNRTCNDINECELGTSGCTQLCNNTNGSYTCFCSMGYTLNVDNHTCYDFDECVHETHGCSHVCNNNLGSYTCSCNIGYTLDSSTYTCSDINECLIADVCSLQVCTNTNGSYICSCSPGSILSADMKTCAAFPANLNTVAVTLAGHTVESFTSDVQGRFVRNVQDIIDAYCINDRCYRDAMIAKHIVTIRSITNSGAGLVVILQVQTSSTVLSAAVVTQALLDGNSTLARDGFVVADVAPYSDPTFPLSSEGNTVAIIVSSAVAALIAVAMLVLLVICCCQYHSKKQKYNATTAEEITMKNLEHMILENEYTIAKNDQFDEVRSVHLSFLEPPNMEVVNSAKEIKTPSDADEEFISTNAVAVL